MNKNKSLSASDVLTGVVNNHQSDRISFGDLKNALHERGFGLLMVIFSMPISLPLPIPPGLTSLPAIPLLIFSIQMLMGLDSPWLPKWISNKTLKRTTLASIVETASPYLMKIEKLLKPRLSFASSRAGEKLIGLFAAVFSVSIMIPVPLTHMVPALGILVMSLGLLSKDGITIIIGMIIGTIGVCISTLVIIMGEKAFLGIAHGM